MATYLAPSRPHPRSYRPDLPMPSVTQIRINEAGVHATASLTAWADSMVRLQAERERATVRPTKAPKAVKTTISASKAHPLSYRPDLPLKGSAGLTTLTAEDRAYYKAHPITLSPSRHACRFMESCETCKANRMSEQAAERARGLFGVLSIVEGEAHA